MSCKIGVCKCPVGKREFDSQLAGARYKRLGSILFACTEGRSSTSHVVQYWCMQMSSWKNRSIVEEYSVDKKMNQWQTMFLFQVREKYNRETYSEVPQQMLPVHERLTRD